MPPDLTKAQEVFIVTVPEGVWTETPFTVPEDGWILNFLCDSPVNAYVEIDGVGSVDTTPGQEVLGDFLLPSGTAVGQPFEKDKHCPYPVKKGQVLTLGGNVVPYTKITFAPCMSI